VVTDVPEPGTYTLMLAGLGIMGLVASGKNRQDSKLLFETQHSPDMAPLRQRFHSFAAPTATPFIESGISTRFSWNGSSTQCFRDMLRSSMSFKSVTCHHSNDK
jgi:hypothetical protein